MGDRHPDAHVKGLLGCSFIALICSRNSATFCSVSFLLNMAQKYRIYINEKVVLLTATPPAQAENYQQLDAEGFDLQIFYSGIDKQHKAARFYILCNTPKTYLKSIIKKNILVKAAGGLVKNSQGDYLFIYRNNKWDLPKGKLEKDEAPVDGAVREVEEECGIRMGKAGKKIVSTYHVYTIKGEVVLKKTWWYKMKYKGSEKLKPQVEEGITEVRWFNAAHIEAVKANTFPSIMDVLQKAGLVTDRAAPL